MPREVFAVLSVFKEMGKQGKCTCKLTLQQLPGKEKKKKQNKLGNAMNRIPPVLQAPKP